MVYRDPSVAKAKSLTQASPRTDADTDLRESSGLPALSNAAIENVVGVRTRPYASARSVKHRRWPSMRTRSIGLVRANQYAPTMRWRWMIVSTRYRAARGSE